MGNKATGPFREAYNPSLQGWLLHRRSEDFNVWQNPSSGEELEEYRFVINDAKEFQHEKEIFEFRYDSSTLVSSRYFREDTQRELCSTYYKGTLFLERIPVRLSHINDLPYPDVLHLYHQAFRGFAELYDKMGYFSIEEGMICLNQQGRVKVWANTELEKSYPVERVMGGSGTEKDMVRRIIQLIDQNTDGLTLPENLGGLLLQADPSTFRDADLMVQNFAARYRTLIPSQIDSVLRREDIVRAMDSVYLHSPGHGSISSPIKQSPSKVPLVVSQPPQGLVNTAAFPQNVTVQQTATSIAPGMVQTFAPQPLVQTFAPSNTQIPQTPVATIVPTSKAATITQQQIQPQPITIQTNRSPVPSHPRSTSFIVRPNSGMPQLASLQQHKHPSFVAAVAQPTPAKASQALHIQQQHLQPVQPLQHLKQNVQVTPVQQSFQQTTAVLKPTTGQKTVENQQSYINNPMRGSYSHRINSRSLAVRSTEHTATAANVQSAQPQSASKPRNYSSMVSLGLKNNLVGAAKKLEEASVEQQRKTVTQVEVQQAQEKRGLATVKSQMITPMQPATGTVATVRETRQSSQVSAPTSHLMQHFNKNSHGRAYSASHSGEFANKLAIHPQQTRESGALFTVTERNNESTPTAKTAPAPTIVFQHRAVTVGELKDEKPRIISADALSPTAALKGSHIFRSSQLHPSIQITYENSRIATNASEVHPPADTNISFGKVESTFQMQSPIHSNLQQSQQHQYTSHNTVAAENLLSSKEILDTISQYRIKKDDHIVNHLPVTYSVLKESEEYLQKYAQARQNEPYYGDAATSGIRASLGSHYNEEELGKNLYYNREQHQQETNQLDEPFRPIYGQTHEEYYSGTQHFGGALVQVHEQKVVERVETLSGAAEMKYSVLEETISSKRFDADQLPLTSTYDQVLRRQLPGQYTTKVITDDYTAGMDSELRKDLEKMRKSQL